MWPTEYKVINQYFLANPQNYAQFDLPGHDGLDIRAYLGSKIFAPAAGVVYRVETNELVSNYGIHVRIDHGSGLKTVLAHLQEAHVVVGQSVAAGQVIGLADSTGNSFGSHLHLTLKHDEAYPGGPMYQDFPYNIIDPLPYLEHLL